VYTFLAPAPGFTRDEALNTLWGALSQFRAFLDENVDYEESCHRYSNHFKMIDTAMQMLLLSGMEGTGQELLFSSAFRRLQLALFIANNVFEPFAHCVATQCLIVDEEILALILPDLEPLKRAQVELAPLVKTAITRLKPLVTDARDKLTVLLSD
jgi:hypothetical protein